MTDKEFKRLKRPQLIEIIYELQMEQEKLNKENAELQRQLEEQRTKIEKAGSIAEATVALSDIFGVAQKAADKYLEEVQAANTVDEKQRLELLQEAQKKADAMVEDAKKQSEEIRREAKADIQSRWEKFEAKVEEVLKANSELKEFLSHIQKK